MDEESGEWIELMEGVPLKGLGESNWLDYCVVDGEKPGVDSTVDGKHIGRNKLCTHNTENWHGD